MQRWPELFLALKFLRPGRSFVSIITLLSWLGVVAGVLVLIVVQSVMRGFEDELTRKVIGFQSHLTVVGRGGPLRDPQNYLNLIRQEEGVLGATPTVVGPVLAEIANRISTPRIKGWDPDSAAQVLPLSDCLVAGTWRLGADEMVVGSEWARANRVEVGSMVNLLGPQQFKEMLAKSNNAAVSLKKIPLPQTFVVAGIFTTGMFDYDSEYLITDLLAAQTLYGVPGAAHGIALKLKNPTDAGRIADSLRGKLGSEVRILTWMDHNQRLFAAVAAERRVMSFLLFFVMAVAALGLSGTLITVTVQRAKTIGTLAALGATPRQIAGIFTFYGVVVGVLGSFTGVVGAWFVLYHRARLSGWIGKLFQQDLFPAEIYHFAELPVRYDGWIFMGVAMAGLGLSVLAALIPAWVASQSEPATNLKRV